MGADPCAVEMGGVIGTEEPGAQDERKKSLLASRLQTATRTRGATCIRLFTLTRAPAHAPTLAHPRTHICTPTRTANRDEEEKKKWRKNREKVKAAREVTIETRLSRK